MRTQVIKSSDVKNAVENLKGFFSADDRAPIVIDCGKYGVAVKQSKGVCEFENVLIDMAQRKIVDTVFCDSVADGLIGLSYKLDDEYLSKIAMGLIDFIDDDSIFDFYLEV